jgi:regulator of protease activity HflC (stomatin/prohibitin superfamily)
MESLNAAATPPSEPEKMPPEPTSPWRRFRLRFGASDFRFSWRPPRRTLLLILAALAAFLLWRAGERGFRSVEPGFLGICVNRFTGTLQALPPGTHFRPPALYRIHAVRVSDQLLSGEAGQFQVATKEGVIARITVQARWAIDARKLVSKWAALPPDPGRELVAPVLFAAFREASPRYEATRLVSEKREELASAASAAARARLSENGIVLKEVFIGDLVLPEEFEKGRVAMVNEIQSTERMDVTLKRKAKEVEETRLTAEAQKARQVQEAEASAAQRVIAARAEADAMKHVLALKEKQIEQRRLEAEAERRTRIERAKAEAEALRIQSQAEAERRRSMADAEAYAIRATSLAQFESLEREAKLVSANPLVVPKTFADKLSDRVQVILTPSIDGDAFTGEIFRRVVNGEPAVQEPDGTRRPAATARAAHASARAN